MSAAGDAPGATGIMGMEDDVLAQIQAKLTPSEDEGDSNAEVEGEASPKPSDDEGPDDAEADEGDDEEDAEDETPDAPEQQTSFKVKVDDEELEVTLDELKRGYSREADYTRKTMALGDAKKAQEAELATAKEALKSEREQYKAVLDYHAQAIRDSFGKPEELERLRHSADPLERQEYAVRVADQVRHKENLAAIEAEKSRLKDQEKQESDKSRKAMMAEETDKLVKAIPEWKDPEKYNKDVGRIVAYAGNLGYRPDELKDIVDHRVLRALHDAARYHELRSKPPVATKPTPAKTVQPVKPGTVAANPNAPKSKEAKLIERARQSKGHLNDIAAILQSRLG